MTESSCRSVLYLIAFLCSMVLSDATLAGVADLPDTVEHLSDVSFSDSVDIFSIVLKNITDIDINDAADSRTMSVEILQYFTCGESAAYGERMFRCELCQSIVPAGTRSTKVILVTRDKTYDERGGGGFAARGGFRKRGPDRGASSPKKNYDKGGEGQEIVREVSVCPKCAANHQRQLEIESSKTNEGTE